MAVAVLTERRSMASLLIVLLILLNAWQAQSATRSPTPGPTAFQRRNATIENGWCIDCGDDDLWVGTYSSNITGFISTYYNAVRYTVMVSNVMNKVWLNSTNGLSYLTLRGNYTANVPIVMISQLILVLDGARLEAVTNFPVTATNPQSNTRSISETKWALVVFNSVYFSGIISPGGPKKATLSCINIPKLGTSSTIVGPAGILMIGSGGILMEGITVDSCGMNNGNFALYGTGRIEVANCVSANARTRGIWVIITSYAIIHDTEIYNTMKFGIDLDANAGPTILIYRCFIHDNAFQAVFIEQGAQFSVVSDNILPRNQNGVSFYNNYFEPVVTDHVILDNLIYGSTAAGINLGSIGPWPSINSYTIGNTLSDSGSQKSVAPTSAPFSAISGYVGSQYTRYAISSNGPVYGMYLLANDDNSNPAQGISPSLFALEGEVLFSDPNNRCTVPAMQPTVYPTRQPTTGGSIRPTPVPTSNPTALNVTINNGQVTSMNGLVMNGLPQISVGQTIGTTCSDLQTFINIYFWNLYIDDPTNYVWIFKPGILQVISFLTLVGDYTCDAPLSIPQNFVLVLNDATLIADSVFPNSALAMIVAQNAHFSGVVSHSGASTAVIDCRSTAVGIYIYNSSYFAVDGVTVQNCGGITGAVVVIGTKDALIGNSTSISNAFIVNATANGIYISQMTRCIVYNTQVLNSYLSGIFATEKSYGPIITRNRLISNVQNGVYIGDGTTVSVIRGNFISSNGGNGIAIYNTIVNYNTTKNVIQNNNITHNDGNSIVIWANGNGARIQYTMVVGNTIFGNSFGIGVYDPDGRGIQNTIYADNKDTDGVTASFLSLLNGNGDKKIDGRNGGNYIFDPCDRATFSTGLKLTPSPSVTVPTSSSPVLSPTVAVPTSSSPVLSPTVAVPTSSSPVLSPTVAVPTSNSPVLSPTVAVPTSSSPVSSPTVAVPTSSSPVSSSPTATAANIFVGKIYISILQKIDNITLHQCSADITLNNDVIELAYDSLFPLHQRMTYNISTKVQSVSNETSSISMMSQGDFVYISLLTTASVPQNDMTASALYTTISNTVIFGTVNGNVTALIGNIAISRNSVLAYSIVNDPPVIEYTYISFVDDIEQQTGFDVQLVIPIVVSLSFLFLVVLSFKYFGGSCCGKSPEAVTPIAIIPCYDGINQTQMYLGQGRDEGIRRNQGSIQRSLQKVEQGIEVQGSAPYSSFSLVQIQASELEGGGRSNLAPFLF